MKSFIQLRENNLTEALYDVKWGIGMEKQVVAKDPAEAIRKAKADLLKSKPKLADPKYADDWKNPRVHKIRESKINEETMELAGATFQNMEHCPGAVSAFKQNLKDGAKEEDVVKAAKAVDAYLAIEDKAKRSGATEADINKMKDLIGKAKSVISQLGLKGHMYHDMHLARVKKMMNEQSEDDMPASPDEKSMAMKQAKFIEYVADEIEEYLEKNKPFPEWMQNKLSAFHEKAKDMHAVLAGDYDDEEDEMKEEKDPRIKAAGVAGYNKPKATPSHPQKSHIVVAKDGDKVKTIRFGQAGVTTAGAPKEGESEKQKQRRKSFKARHAENIAKGKMSAAYWADKVKW